MLRTFSLSNSGLNSINTSSISNCSHDISPAMDYLNCIRLSAVCDNYISRKDVT